ncbi:MAG: rubrerythrin [Desulfuromonas sp.]|nr:MAG: rubrerythrin [Desulfuromonas sp.]
MSTKDNLADAFAGESQANRKYLAFAKQAETDGLPQVAKLFRAAAHAETIHAHAHLRAMGGINKTEENLAAAIEGEGFEFQKMYPPYLEEAQKEGDRMAEVSFRNALAVEEVHYELYSKALEAVKVGGDLPQREVYVCEICGNTVYDHAPDKCDVCGVPKERFSKID